MKKYILENSTNTVEVSQMALGHLFMNLPHRTESSYAYMEEFLEFGGTTFDNARIYGDFQSERFLGEFFKKTGKRHDMVITSKCSHHNRKPLNRRVNAACINSDIDTSLTMLQTDYIDIFYLHRDDIGRPVEEIMIALDRLVKDGKVRILGASNWSAPRIQKANDFALSAGLTPFSVSQINYSIALTTPVGTTDTTSVAMDHAEKSWYEKSRMLVMPWAPNARGFFSQIAKDGKSNQRTSEYYGWCPENFRRAERVIEVANRVGFPVGTVVLAYLLCQNIDVCPVIAFTKPEQFAEAKMALDCHLTQHDIDFINGKFAEFTR